MLCNKEESVAKEKELIFDPLFMCPGGLDVNLMKTLATTHPCECTAETIYFSGRRLFIMVWDMEDLRSMGLPPSDAQTVIWPLESYLLLRFPEANPDKFEIHPELKSMMKRVNYRKQIDLFDAFIKLT